MKHNLGIHVSRCYGGVSNICKQHTWTSDVFSSIMRKKQKKKKLNYKQYKQKIKTKFNLSWVQESAQCICGGIVIPGFFYFVYSTLLVLLYTR